MLMLISRDLKTFESTLSSMPIRAPRPKLPPKLRCLSTGKPPVELYRLLSFDVDLTLDLYGLLAHRSLLCDRRVVNRDVQ
jgi:hypothetical protein